MSITSMIKKEFKENLKNYKLLVVPVAFALVTLMTPLMTLFLPDLMKNSADLPAGTIIEIPEIGLADMLNTFFTDIPQISSIVIILLIMGTIANERNSGVASMVLVKPMSTTSYFLSKLISNSALILVSYFIGNLISLYYCDSIKGGVNWGDGLLGIISIMPLVFLIVSIVMFFSSFLKSALGIAGASFGTTLILLMVPQYISKSLVEFCPDTLLKNSTKLLSSLPVEDVWQPILFVLTLSIVFILAGCIIFKKQDI